MNYGIGLGVSQQSSQAYLPRQIDIFVDGALGHDSNAGTFNSPLKTFQAAINSADELYNPGNNNIFLKPGAYGGGVINDDDMLRVFGLGVNPWDVSVMGDSTKVDTIHIDGGSDVRLYNMRVSGSSGNGIFAEDLNNLFMDRVISKGHSQSGFFGSDISQTKIFNSSFKYNNEYGALFDSGQLFRAVNSHFDNNDNGGVAIFNVDSVEMIGSTALGNQQEVDLAFAVALSSGNGLTVNMADSVLVNGGDYSDNSERGIELNQIGTLSLLGVRAAWNGHKGALAQSFGTALISGGRYEYNGDDGLALEGGVTSTTAFAEEEPETMVTVYGGQFFNNVDDGLELRRVYDARLFGVDARNNEDDGIDGVNIYNLRVAGGYLLSNHNHGTTLGNIHYTQVNDLVSRQNDGSGLSSDGGYRLSIIGGVYSDNDEWGISVVGSSEEVGLKRVDIKFATVLNNYYGGVFVANSYLAKMVGGTYSSNEYDGIVMGNVSHGIFENILVRDNGEYGLWFNTGNGNRYSEPDGEQSVSARLDDGPNWNRLDFLGGWYNNNGEDGIHVATNENREFVAGNIHIQADFVVARDNGGTGFNVGGNKDYDEVANLDGYGYGANLYLQMTGGYYSFNGDDGIYLLGNGNVDPTLGLLTAKMTDVVAEFNDRYGVHGTSIIGQAPLPSVLEYGEGESENGSLIHVVRGFYGFNGNDGLNFQVRVFIDGGQVPGGGGALNGAYDLPEFGSLATFDHVVAFHNGGNGLWFDTFIHGETDIPDGGDEGQSFAVGLETAYPPLINILGGVYNLNQNNGISLTSSAENVDGPDWLEEDIAAVELTDVVANVNGWNGLFIRNHNPEVFRGDVNILRGVFNANKVDGVFVEGMAYLDIYKAVIAANRDDGVHSRNNSSTTTNTSVIVGNLNQNVRIEP